MRNIKKLQASIRCYIKPWVDFNIKTECEICGRKDSLQLHHIDYLNDIIYEEITKLGYHYLELNKEKFNKVRFNVIRIHMENKVRYQTLCEKCHKELHSEQRVTRYFTVAESKKIIIKKHNEFMKKYVNTPNIDLDEFCKTIKCKDKDIVSLNNKMRFLKIRYTFINKNNRMVLKNNVDLILNSFTGRYLFKKDKEDLSSQLKPYLSTTKSRKNIKTFNLTFINAYLNQFNYKYILNDKRVMNNGKRVRVWEIKEISVNN